MSLTARKVAHLPPRKQQKSVSTRVVDTLQSHDFNLFPRDILFFALLPACTAFIIYCLCLQPFVAGGDNGELLVAAYQWSTAHPPGYPLWTTLAHLLIRFLPFWTVASRAALLSAFGSSTAIYFLAVVTSELTGSLACGAFGGLLFGLSPLVWQYSTHAEVFGLHNGLTALLLHAVIKFAQSKTIIGPRGQQLRLQVALWGAFLCGLCLTNQHTAIVFQVPIVIWVFFFGNHQEFLHQPRIWLQFSMAFLLGLSAYILLPLQQLFSHQYIWGDTLSVAGFIRHLARGDYGTLQLFSGDTSQAPTISEKLSLYLFSMNENLMYLGLPIGLLGIFEIVQSSSSLRRSIIQVMSVCLLFYVFGFFALCNLPIKKAFLRGVFKRFFMQPDLIMTIMTAIGLHRIVSWIFKNKFKRELLFTLLTVILLSVQCWLYYNEMNQSQNDLVEKYGHYALDSFPSNSIVLVKGDLIINSIQYLRLCQAYRQDVHILSMEHMTYEWFIKNEANLYPNVTFPGTVYHPFKPGGYSIEKFVQANHAHFEIFMIGGLREDDPSARSLLVTPFGFGNRLRPRNDPVSLDQQFADIHHNRLAIWFNQSIYSKYTDETWERVVMDDYFNYIQNAEASLIMIGDAIQAQKKPAKHCFLLCIDLFERLFDHFERLPHTLYLNYGLCLDRERVYHNDNQIQAHKAKKMIEAWQIYVDGASPTDRDLLQIRNAIQEWQNFLSATEN